MSSESAIVASEHPSLSSLRTLSALVGYVDIRAQSNCVTYFISACIVASISPHGGNVPQNTTFTCSTEGNEAVSSYQWTVETGAGILSEQGLTLVSVGKYEITCIAISYLSYDNTNICSKVTYANGISSAAMTGEIFREY